MGYEIVTMTGKQWPFEAVAQIGDINRRALERVTDLQLDLVNRNLDALLELASQTTRVWLESRDDYLSLLDRVYQDNLKKPVTVTKTVKAAKKKTEAAVKRAKPKSNAARKRQSTIES